MEDKIHEDTTKYLLKKAVEGLIPDEIIYRKKVGFGAPMSTWMRGDYGQYVEDSMMSSKLLERGFFNRRNIANLFKDHGAGHRGNSLYISTFSNLTAWYGYWIDGRSQ